MPFPHKLSKLASEKGISVDQLVDEAMREHVTAYRAATALGVYPNAIRYNLSKREEKMQSGPVAVPVAN